MDVLLTRRARGRADCGVSQIRRGDAHRPGLRDHGRRLGRRLDLGRAIDARLPARRIDHGPDGRTRAAHGLVGAGAFECREDLVESERLLWLSIDVPASRRQLIDDDDRIGAGVRNPVKRWWFDLEIVDGVAVAPIAGVNERDLDLTRQDKLAAVQKLAFFPPALQPAGGTTLQTVVPLDRQAGLTAYAAAELPIAARLRRAKPAESPGEQGTSE